MLPIFLAQVAATTLAIVSPPKWSATVTQGTPPAEQHVDVVLKNGTRSPMFWHLMDLPPWVDCWQDPARHELGHVLYGFIDPGTTSTVRFDIGAIPASYVPGEYVWDISFMADGSKGHEVWVDCSLIVMAPL